MSWRPFWRHLVPRWQSEDTEKLGLFGLVIATPLALMTVAYFNRPKKPHVAAEGDEPFVPDQWEPPPTGEKMFTPPPAGYKSPPRDPEASPYPPFKPPAQSTRASDQSRDSYTPPPIVPLVRPDWRAAFGLPPGEGRSAP